MPLVREKVDLCYMMVQISDELYLKLKERGKTMELDVPEDMTLYADTDKMARVFNNILKNAIAYSEDTGPIRFPPGGGRTGGHPLHQSRAIP